MDTSRASRRKLPEYIEGKDVTENGPRAQGGLKLERAKTCACQEATAASRLSPAAVGQIGGTVEKQLPLPVESRANERTRGKLVAAGRRSLTGN